MIYKSTLNRMDTKLNDVVEYSMHTDDILLEINKHIGSTISIRSSGQYKCIVCKAKVKNLIAQGMCYNCFTSAPENSECIFNPELCLGHLGRGRNVDWEKANHVQPHVVYLALTGTVKVGVTRATQIPTRWMDQGAWKVIKLAETPYRQLAGAIEIALKPVLTDKTNWQRMLKNDCDYNMDLLKKKDEIIDFIVEDFENLISMDDAITEITYPVSKYPDKVRSVNLSKTPNFTGVLSGIRGQYLIFESGEVLNVRSHSGFMVDIEII